MAKGLNRKVPPPSGPSRLRTLARLLFVAAALGVLFWTLVRQGDDLSRRAEELSLAALGGALATALAALACTLLAWQTVLGGLGSPLPSRTAARIFFLGQLGKYLPGGGWPVIAHVELARDMGVPRKRVAAATLITLSVGVLTGLVIAGVFLALPGSGRLRSPLWLLIVPPALVCLLDRRVLTWAFNSALRAARRTPLDHLPSRRAYRVAVGWAFGSWLLFGAQVWILALDLGAEGPRLPIDAIGTFAIAWIAGFIAPFAPAGLGLREVVLGFGVGTALGSAAAAVLALTSRVVITLGDLLAASMAEALERRRRSHPASRAEAGETAQKQPESTGPSTAAAERTSR